MQVISPNLPVIVILGAVRYNSHIQSTSFNTAYHFAKKTKVFYIENPLTFKDVVSEKLSKNGNQGSQRRESSFSLSENLTVVTPPPMLSIHFLPESVVYRSLLKINEKILGSFIKKLLKLHNITKFIFINSFNFHYPSIGKKIKPLLNIYQCVDPLIVPFDRKHGITSEAKLVNECDVIFCTSKALYKDKLSHNNNTFFIPNAANIHHFTKVMDEGLVVHASIKHRNKPIIGYIGTIERRFDYPLVQELIQLNPDKEFVFAGPLDESHVPSWFYSSPNLQLLGTVKYEELPSVIKGFDVCIIPFKRDNVSRTIFPLKLFEFMGSGKPVIATDFNPDLKEYTGETVFYGSNAQELSDEIELILASPNKNRHTQLEIARINTWEERVKQMIVILENKLEEKDLDLKNRVQPPFLKR